MTYPSMDIVTAILGQPTQLVERCIESWRTTHSQHHAAKILMNTPESNAGVTGSLQLLYEATSSPIIAFIHSDCEIYEQNWDERVLREFDDPKVGVVGFGGGLQHGSQDIYKTPYSLQQLGRGAYLSNVNDAELHGTRFTGSCEVAVLDGFCLVIRRSLLDRMGGWPVKALPFHSYDYWSTITAHKLDYKVRLVGIRCHHHGGQTSTTPQYQEWCLKTLGKTDAQVHEDSHRFIYEYARGYLPWRCPQPELGLQNAHHNHLPTLPLSVRREGVHVPGDIESSSLPRTSRVSSHPPRPERGEGLRGGCEAVLPTHQGQWLSVEKYEFHESDDGKLLHIASPPIEGGAYGGAEFFKPSGVRPDSHNPTNANGPSDQPVDQGGDSKC